MKLNEHIIKRMFRKNVKLMKQISNQYTKADMDFIFYGKCSYNGNLREQKLVSEMKIYIDYLGFIDGLLMHEAEKIEQVSAAENEESKSECQQRYHSYLEQRNKLIRIIESQTAMGNTHSIHFQFLKEVLESIPASEKFYLIRQNRAPERSYRELQMEFMDSYYAGFSQCDYIDYQKLTDLFETSIQSIEAHKLKNQQKIAQARLVKQLNR